MVEIISFIGNIKKKIVETIYNYNIDSYLENLHLKYKDKVVILLGETGVGKSSFINSITESNKCDVSPGSKSCTKGLQLVKLFDSGYNYFFIDTPGLNDSMGDSEHIDLLKKLSKKGILSTIILLNNYNIKRLSASYEKILKTYMEIFPSENFWEHVLYVESHFFYEDPKESLADAIRGSQFLTDFMEKKNIILPQNIKTFQIDLKKPYEENKDIFQSILENINNMHPLYKRYKEEDKFIINEKKNANGVVILEYEYKKIIDYTNFEGISSHKEETIESGQNPENSSLLEQIIVEREKDLNDVIYSNWPCCEDYAYRVYYWEIKLYKFSGNIYRMKSLYVDGYESDDKKGEKYRRKIETELNKSHNIKNI